MPGNKKTLKKCGSSMEAFLRTLFLDINVFLTDFLCLQGKFRGQKSYPEHNKGQFIIFNEKCLFQLKNTLSS